MTQRGKSLHCSPEYMLFSAVRNNFMKQSLERSVHSKVSQHDKEVS